MTETPSYSPADLRAARRLLRPKSVLGADFDVCCCGDYRHNHGPDGCRYNGAGHGGEPDCAGFQLAKKQEKNHGAHSLDQA